MSLVQEVHQPLSIALAKLSESDIQKHLSGPPQYTEEDLRKKIPAYFHLWLKCFLSDSDDRPLPAHSQHDHPIELKPGAIPPFSRARPTPPAHRETIRKVIEDGLRKGTLRPSTSSACSPILLVAKPSGGVRMCVDYRKLNELTVKRRHPIPLLSETLTNLGKAQWYTKLDIRAAFNQLRIREGDEWLTSFATRLGQFEWLVMPFGLCGAPATWQAYIQSIIRPWIDRFVTAYLDDILIYSDTKDEHITHVRTILEALSKANLPIDVDKCSFLVQRVDYLGLIITPQGIEMDPKKLSSIRDWSIPSSPHDLHSFVGFCNFYRRFIPNFSKLATPLNNLLKCKVSTEKGRRRVIYPPFVWTPDCQQAFDSLKAEFAVSRVLAHFNPELPTVVETDASDMITAGVLSQRHAEGLRPVAFFSHRMSPAEGNYAIYDKELLAIIRAFELWRPELLGVHTPTKVLTDHQSLKYFMSTKTLSHRQARWAEFLSQFQFLISYRPGKDNTVADLLSRSAELSQAQKDQVKHRTMTLLTDANIDPDLKVALSLVWSSCPVERSLEEVSLSLCPISSAPVASPDVTDPSPNTNNTQDNESGSDNEDTIDNANLISPFELDSVRQASALDDDINAIHDLLDSCARRLPAALVRRGYRFSLADFEFYDGLLHVQGRILIPQDHDIKLSILQQYHDSRLFGHPSEKTLFRLISRFYWWLGLRSDCARYCSSCHTCCRSKPNNLSAPGFLQPIPLPQRAWSDISIDLAEDLPLCVRKGRAYQHVLVVVDRLTKDRIFEPLMFKSAEEIVKCLHRRVYCVHGFPNSIISDRGSAFTSELNTRYAAIYNIRLLFASPHHPQTDGQSEAVVKSLKTYLREFVRAQQSDWADYLPDAEFVSQPQSASLVEGPAYLATRRSCWAYGCTAKASHSDQARGHVRLGPWRVIRSIRNHAFQVDIPAPLLATGASTIINGQFLRLAQPLMPGQLSSLSPILRPADNQNAVFPEWEVDSIVACRVTARHGLQYKAYYKDSPEWNSRPRWQPWTDFEHAPQAILDFHAENPSAPSCPIASASSRNV
ncbi:Ribonuclease H-like protein [Ascosphaera apis ARSEF 7405]|uniref:Ribonuclease H-like protein n=1 Tax=Ascosphaera apis ARSEF 7405 TaxID=392613 RepID=A0A167V6X7_9EURO|nr:Ribonuclease H-like protein [Ascosphaera apis ARSEF 7405]